jgi:hypothetical protein
MEKLEQLKADLNADPDYAKAVMGHIMETDGAKEIIENAKNSHWEENIRKDRADYYSKWDNEIFEKHGIRKEATQKTNEFLWQQVDQASQYRKIQESLGDRSIDDISSVFDENARLKEAVENGSGAEIYKKNYEDAQKEISALQSQLSDSRDSVKKIKIENELAKGLANLKFNPNIPKNVIDSYIDKAQAELVKNAREEDGNIVFFDASGSIIKMPDYSHAKGSDVLGIVLKDILDVEKTKGGGSGAGGDKIEIPEDKDKPISISIANVSQFRSKDEVISHVQKMLIGKGVAKGSAQWDKTIDTVFDKHPTLSKLPMF